MNYCRCGCGEATNSTWAPGHDGRYVWKLIKEYGGTVPVVELLELLIAQLQDDEE